MHVRSRVLEGHPESVSVGDFDKCGCKAHSINSNGDLGRLARRGYPGRGGSGRYPYGGRVGSDARRNTQREYREAGDEGSRASSRRARCSLRR